jgi:opacity protein-like surface antigen
MQCTTVRHIVRVALLAGFIASPAVAEDVEKKFRIGLAVGVFDAQDEIGSDAGNVLRLVDDDLLTEKFYVDPRNDSAVLGALSFNPGFSGTIYGQYAFSKIFVVEASLGYAKLDLGDVELQAQFDGEPIPDFQPFLFHVTRIPVGQVTRVPLSVAALARLRPRSSFNPYFGIGLGYTFHGLKVDDEFNQLSINMDGSLGALATVSAATFGNPSFTFPGDNELQDLTGATVEIGDAFEWHLAAGAEYTFKSKWAVILDLRWSFSNDNMAIKFNGKDDLGVAVPERVDFIGSEFDNGEYGGFLIKPGGLVDGGVLVPAASAPGGTDCSVAPGNCIFDSTQRDGLTDPGIYYVQGGALKYGGISLQLGVRYTF